MIAVGEADPTNGELIAMTLVMLAVFAAAALSMLVRAVRQERAFRRARANARRRVDR